MTLEPRPRTSCATVSGRGCPYLWGFSVKRRCLRARHLAVDALRAVAGLRQDLEVGYGVERRGRAVVLGEGDDEAVEAGGEVVVVDLWPGRGGVAALGADAHGEDPVRSGILGEVEGAPDQATLAEGAVDRSLQLDRIDAIGHAVEAKADVALVQARFSAEVARRELEVLHLDLDDDGVAGLPGAAAGRDHADRRPSRHGRFRRLRPRAVLAPAERQHRRNHRGGDRGNDENGVSRLHGWREP